MRGPTRGFRVAFQEGRYYDAARDEKLHRRCKKRDDPMARSLVMVASAHLHASRENWAGAKARLVQAEPYLEQLDDKPLALELQRHVAAAEACCDVHKALPNLRLR